MSLNTVPVQILGTPSHSVFILYFMYFLHCRLKHPYYEGTNVAYGVNKKVLNRPEYVLYISALMTYLHTLGILSIRFMR